MLNEKETNKQKSLLINEMLKREKARRKTVK